MSKFDERHWDRAHSRYYWDTVPLGNHDEWKGYNSICLERRVREAYTWLSQEDASGVNLGAYAIAQSVVEDIAAALGVEIKSPSPLELLADQAE